MQTVQSRAKAEPLQEAYKVLNALACTQGNNALGHVSTRFKSAEQPAINSQCSEGILDMQPKSYWVTVKT